MLPIILLIIATPATIFAGVSYYRAVFTATTPTDEDQ